MVSLMGLSTPAFGFALILWRFWAFWRGWFPCLVFIRGDQRVCMLPLDGTDRRLV